MTAAVEVFDQLHAAMRDDATLGPLLDLAKPAVVALARSQAEDMLMIAERFTVVYLRVTGLSKDPGVEAALAAAMNRRRASAASG